MTVLPTTNNHIGIYSRNTWKYYEVKEKDSVHNIVKDIEREYL
jgi:putative ubiquitin-RnfH superfamily antitoxin RatB of RatAB toxin-antitoxin module